MFKNTCQSGLLTVFYSLGASPLAIWESKVENGHIKRLTDCDVKSLVLEIVGTNVATTYISCPKDKGVLGIRLPFLVMILKNLKRYFSFEVTILDDTNMRRRFRVSNFQSTTKIQTFCTSMPINLSAGWNQIQFNLVDFTKKAYGTAYMETVRMQIHANTRLRRIYFCDRLCTEEELPKDYKLFLPMQYNAPAPNGEGDGAVKADSIIEYRKAKDCQCVEPAISEEFQGHTTSMVSLNEALGDEAPGDEVFGDIAPSERTASQQALGDEALGDKASLTKHGSGEIQPDETNVHEHVLEAEAVTEAGVKSSGESLHKGSQQSVKSLGQKSNQSQMSQKKMSSEQVTGDVEKEKSQDAMEPIAEEQGEDKGETLEVAETKPDEEAEPNVEEE